MQDKLRFEDLIVYQKALDIVEDAYRITRLFPSEERFALTSQLQRAATSIVANIAEGCGRFHNTEQIQFLRMSRGSAYECVALLQIAKRLKVVNETDYNAIFKKLMETTRMLSGLVVATRKK